MTWLILSSRNFSKGTFPESPWTISITTAMSAKNMLAMHVQPSCIEIMIKFSLEKLASANMKIPKAKKMLSRKSIWHPRSLAAATLPLCSRETKISLKSFSKEFHKKSFFNNSSKLNKAITSVATILLISKTFLKEESQKTRFNVVNKSRENSEKKKCYWETNWTDKKKKKILSRMKKA